MLLIIVDVIRWFHTFIVVEIMVAIIVIFLCCFDTFHIKALKRRFKFHFERVIHQCLSRFSCLERNEEDVKVHLPQKVCVQVVTELPVIMMYVCVVVSARVFVHHNMFSPIFICGNVMQE